MRFVSRLVALCLGCFAGAFAAQGASTPSFALKEGDRVVFLGDTLAEREQTQGWIEVMLTTRFPDKAVTFRNLGWSGDTPAGESRLGLSLLQAGHEPADEGWKQLTKQLSEAKPTVIFIGYGMASSFAGEPGLAKFRGDYAKLLDQVAESNPGARLVLLAPVAHEKLGAPWPDPAAHNASLALYSRAVAEIARERGAWFVPLYELLSARPNPGRTNNGIHPTAAGYREIAGLIEDQLLGALPSGAVNWRTSNLVGPLRQAILRKNEAYFSRSRPANMAYIFGFRKHEQGKNAAEVLKFDELVATGDAQVARLRALQPATGPEIATLPEPAPVPVIDQPHPAFQVADGYEVTLWAENPLLHKPTQMTFDARGRLWVTSSELYPQIEPGQAETDKIIVLEDTLGAGKADKATVFADGLLIPTGLEVGDGGVYVAQSTELLHFKDTDGDGKADVRRIVLSGFGTEDTHHNLHTLRWGPDGRLYFNQSVYTRTNTETPTGVVRLLAGGIFRFDPRDERMETVYRGWVNAWGHQFDDYGQSFMTDGAGGRGVSWGVPGATYQTLAPARRVLQSASPGSYPKFAGIEIVRSSIFPPDWQGDVITCDFRAHRVVHFKLADQGAGFVTTEQPDLLRTTSDSFRPIDARMGPDGALYIADWSNPIIQHGEVDFRDPRRDKTHGRIWRVAPTGSRKLAKVDFPASTNATLLGLLGSPNGYEKEQAKRVLVERGKLAVLPDLASWTARLAAGDEKGRLNALWMYQALDAVPDALLDSLLAAKDFRVRAAAVRAIPVSDGITRLEKRIMDENPRVRLEALRALGQRPSLRSAELALSVLGQPTDPFTDYALWLTINELAGPWLGGVKNGEWKIDGREKQLEFGMNAVEPALASDVLGGILTKQGIPADGSGPWIELIGSAGGPRELALLFDRARAGEMAEPIVVRSLEALRNAARLRKVRPSGDLSGVATLMADRRGAVRLAGLALAGTWRVQEPAVVAVAREPATGNAERSAAFSALREIGGDAVLADLKGLGAANSPAAVRREAVLTLASLDLPTAFPGVIALLQETMDDADAQVLWRRLLGIRGLSAKLAGELPAKALAPAMARAGLRPAREGTQHQALVAVLLQAAGLAATSGQLTPAEMQAIARDALAKGDPVSGEKLFRRADLACLSCHAIGGAGGKLGPDLTSIGASAPTDYLVESLLYPNAKIKEGYHSVLLSTQDGRDLNGMIVRETPTEILLRAATNEEISVPVNTLTRRTSVGSLMPAGLMDSLLPEERLDLVKFLSELGRPGAYDASKGNVAREWKLYLVTSKNDHLGIERVIRGDPGLADWMPAFSLVDGVLPVETIEAAFPDRAGSRALFAAVQFQATKPGEVTFTVSGEVLGAWANGEPIKTSSALKTFAKPGTNTLVLQLNPERPPGRLKISSAMVTFGER